MEKSKRICFASVDVEEWQEKDFQGAEQIDKILDIFKKWQIPAVLFVSGIVLEKYPEKFKELSKDFEIASHSFTHRFWDKLSQTQREQEIDKFFAVYSKIFHSIPQGFRAPSYVMDTAGIKLLEQKGFKYDSSILPHYPFCLKFRGFSGKAPKSPYHPSVSDCRRFRDPVFERGEDPVSIWEIPVTGQVFGLPLSGTWLRKLPFIFYRLLFLISKPKFITLNLHSWDVLRPKTLRNLQKLIKLIKTKNYQFINTRQFYEMNF